jgi:hypothetical protein
MRKAFALLNAIILVRDEVGVTTVKTNIGNILLLFYQIITFFLHFGVKYISNLYQCIIYQFAFALVSYLPLLFVYEFSILETEHCHEPI